jgi:hypothetical protein
VHSAERSLLVVVRVRARRHLSRWLLHHLLVVQLPRRPLQQLDLRPLLSAGGSLFRGHAPCLRAGACP